jgi:hypothetical protein
MRVWPIAFTGTHRRAAAIRIGGRGARMESMAEADLRNRTKSRAIIEVRACDIGVNAESAK